MNDKQFKNRIYFHICDIALDNYNTQVWHTTYKFEKWCTDFKKSLLNLVNTEDLNIQKKVSVARISVELDKIFGLGLSECINWVMKFFEDEGWVFPMGVMDIYRKHLRVRL